jgi:hypothetical protein
MGTKNILSAPRAAQYHQLAASKEEPGVRHGER